MIGAAPGLDDIYQRVILDHSRHPRNFRPPAEAARTARGDNPFCGDRVTVSCALSGDRIADVAFEGVGCAISMASASMMTERTKGLTRAEAEALCQRFELLLLGAPADHQDLQERQKPQEPPTLGELAAFGAVSRFPVRVKCARLAWQTLLAALGGADGPVSTE